VTSVRLAVGLVAVACVTACGRVRFDGLGDAIGDGAATCPPSALVCDDFEAGNLGRWSRTIINPNSTLQLEQQLIHGGASALDANIGPQPGTGGVTDVVYDQPVQTTGVLATRAWIYAPIALTNYEGVMEYADSDAFNAYALALCASTGMWGISEGSPASGFMDHVSTVPCVAATWQCVELVYQLSAPRRAQLWVDNVMVVDVTPIDTAPAFTFAGVGASRSDLDGTRVIVDDAVVANQRIGCP
jgi:hypothetical protein